MDRTLQQDNTRVHSVEPIQPMEIDPETLWEINHKELLARQGTISAWKPPGTMTPEDAQFAFDMMIAPATATGILLGGGLLAQGLRSAAPVFMPMLKATVPLIKPALKYVGSNLFKVYTHPTTQAVLAADGISDAASDNGLKKTLTHIDKGEYGQAALSGTVDVVDLAGVGGALKTFKNIGRTVSGARWNPRTLANAFYDTFRLGNTSNTDPQVEPEPKPSYPQYTMGPTTASMLGLELFDNGLYRPSMAPTLNQK